MRTGLSRSGTRLGGGLARLGAGAPLERGRSSLGPGGGLFREPGGWRRALGLARWLVLPLLLLLVLLVSSQLDPSAPPAPRPNVGAVHVPNPPLPTPPGPPGAPPVSVPTPPTPPIPNLGLPEAPSAHVPGPGINLPDGGGSPGSTSSQPSEPYHPRTIRHLTVRHIHHLRIVWEWSWLLIALVVGGGAAGYLLLRRPRQDKLVRSGLVVAVALTLALLSTLVGVHQVPGPGTYRSNPVIEVEEHHDSMGNRIIELERTIDHFHPPLDIEVALLLLAAGLIELAIPSARVLVRAARAARRARRAELRPERRR
ncbi:MAG: hypothetical protein ACOYD4_11830 [Solirubrobacterales bacterium]